MAKLKLTQFFGENRALHPYNLPIGVGTVSLNQNPSRGDLRPWKVPLTVATVPIDRNTIYRMGRDTVSDTNYWLSWAAQVDVVRGFNAQDTGEKTYYTGDGVPKWTNTTQALNSAPYPTSARLLGVPRPATACLLVAVGGISTTTHSRYYTYTYVTDEGEEGQPAPVTLELVCKVDATVNITAIAAPPSGNYGINRVRIYRTQSGQSGDVQFFFLREQLSSLTTSTDDLRALGEVLTTTNWLVPPADLKQLTGLWNGMMAGISGRGLRFCEAYVPYAWPIGYEILPPHSTPVALAAYGQTLVVLTNGNPIVVTGGSPDSMDEQPLDFLQACVSARSVVSLGHGVAWASPDGLAYVGSGGARLLTTGAMTREDWQALNPSTIHGHFYEGRYFGFYEVSTGFWEGFVIDPSNPSGMFFLAKGYPAAYVDDLQDALYVLDGTDIKKWDAGAEPMMARFKSSEMRPDSPLPAMTAAKVVADDYPVNFSLWVDGVLRWFHVALNALPFRLPSGYRGAVVQLEVETAYPVQKITAAHSIKELEA